LRVNPTVKIPVEPAHNRDLLAPEHKAQCRFFHEWRFNMKFPFTIAVGIEAEVKKISPV
jgi:hypothetical protein